jgi:hypothetical protein
MTPHRLVEREGATEGRTSTCYDQVEARVDQHRAGRFEMERSGNDIFAVGFKIVRENT